MATDIQINAAVDAILSAFDSDPVLWQAFLDRARLETELAQLESQRRVLQTAESASDEQYTINDNALVESIEEKKAEIDAL